METVGIICEYNPLHLGHLRQMQEIRRLLGADTAIVCLMSGNFVQRGHPAIVDKSLRAKAAVDCGADLVLELPVTCALSSAEGFAAGGVKLLSPFCTHLCFGAESGTAETLMATAQALLSPPFGEELRRQLALGISFPAARQAALEQLGADASLLRQPNDLLAVEYCKALLAQNSPMRPLPLRRPGSYHAAQADPACPSATAVRSLMLSGGDWAQLVPPGAFAGAKLHSLETGERSILARLRTMSDEEFEVLPYGSEGLWRKLMHESRRQATLEGVLTAVKSKRYTRSRLDRMVLCAFLGIDKERLSAPAPYCRVLGLSGRGRAVLNQARQAGAFPHIGQAVEGPYWTLEQRCDDLYGLFAIDAPEAPGQAPLRRVYYRD